MISTNSLTPRIPIMPEMFFFPQPLGPRLAVNSQLSPEISWVRSKTKLAKQEKYPAEFLLICCSQFEDAYRLFCLLQLIWRMQCFQAHKRSFFVGLFFLAGSPSAFSGFLPPWIWHSRWSSLASEAPFGGRFGLPMAGVFLHFKFYMWWFLWFVGNFRHFQPTFLLGGRWWFERFLWEFSHIFNLELFLGEDESFFFDWNGGFNEIRWRFHVLCFFSMFFCMAFLSDRWRLNFVLLLDTGIPSRKLTLRIQTPP